MEAAAAAAAAARPLAPPAAEAAAAEAGGGGAATPSAEPRDDARGPRSPSSRARRQVGYTFTPPRRAARRRT